MLSANKFALGLLLVCSSATPAIAHADQEAQAATGTIESIEPGSRTIQIDGKKYRIDPRNPSCRADPNASAGYSAEDLQRGQAVLFRVINAGTSDNATPDICIIGGVH